MPDMQPSEMRDAVLDILVDEYKQNCNYDALMAIMGVFATHQRRAVTRGKIEELKQAWQYKSYESAMSYIEGRIEELETELRNGEKG